MGAFWMLVAGLLFACMGVFVKLGTPYFSNMELVFYRSFMGLVLVSVIFLHTQGTIRTMFWKSHLWRGISGSIALVLFFYCITRLPLATAITLNYTSPLFLTLLTLFVFRESFSIPMILAVFIGFIGTIFLLRPTIDSEHLVTGLLGLLSGFLAAVAMFNVRQLSRSGEPEYRIVFYFSLIATLMSGSILLMTATHSLNWDHFLILIGLALSGTLAQLALTRAYATGNTALVSTFSYSTIVFASFFGIFFWHESLPAEGMLGMGLIIASGVLSFKSSPKLEGKDNDYHSTK